MDYKHIDLAYLRLMSAGSTAAEEEMLKLLLTDLSEQLPKLEAAIEKTQWEAIKHISHHLKSSFSFVGNDQLLSAIRAVEQLAERQEAYDEIARSWLLIKEVIPEVQAELKRALEDVESRD